MAGNRLKVTSNFRAVKSATREAFREGIQEATNAMEGEAEKRLERIDDAHGYELPIDVQGEATDKDGRIVYPHFFGRFFEYGTVHIPASPFIRPAHRKGRKVLRDYLADNYEGTVRRRAGIHR